MDTYTFTSVANGYPKFKVNTDGYHVPRDKPRLDEYASSLILRADALVLSIYPATDTVIIDGSTHAPGSLTVSQLSDLLNVLFPKANSSTGGTGAGATAIGGSYDNNAAAVAALGAGALYQSTTLINGSPIILKTV